MYIYPPNLAELLTYPSNLEGNSTHCLLPQDTVLSLGSSAPNHTFVPY